MNNIEISTRLGFVIEKLIKAEEYALANELSEIQINLIEDRSRGWNEGFNIGYNLAVRKNEISDKIARL